MTQLRAWFMCLAGLLIGVAVAAALTRPVSGVLVKVSAVDPRIFSGAALFLAAAALIASYVAARRAMRVDSMVALRDE